MMEENKRSCETCKYRNTVVCAHCTCDMSEYEEGESLDGEIDKLTEAVCALESDIKVLCSRIENKIEKLRKEIKSMRGENHGDRI